MKNCLKKKEKKRKTRVKENFPNTETVTHRYSTKLQSYCCEKLGQERLEKYSEKHPWWSITSVKLQAFITQLGPHFEQLLLDFCIAAAA